jgi:hypothetical protein
VAAELSRHLGVQDGFALERQQLQSPPLAVAASGTPALPFLLAVPPSRHFDSCCIKDLAALCKIKCWWMFPTWLSMMS